MTSKKTITPIRQHVEHTTRAARHRVVYIGKEIGVLKIKENTQIHAYAECKPTLFRNRILSRMYFLTHHKVPYRSEQQEQEKQPCGFIIKKQTCPKQKGVPCNLALVNKSICSKNDCKENPEVYGCKNKRGLWIKSQKRCDGRPPLHAYFFPLKVSAFFGRSLEGFSSLRSRSSSWSSLFRTSTFGAVGLAFGTNGLSAHSGV